LGTGVRIMVLLPFVLKAMPVMRVAPLWDRMRHVRAYMAMAGGNTHVNISQPSVVMQTSRRTARQATIWSQM
jgi:hypothetical protein